MRLVTHLLIICQMSVVISRMLHLMNVQVSVDAVSEMEQATSLIFVYQGAMLCQ